MKYFECESGRRVLMLKSFVLYNDSRIHSGHVLNYFNPVEFFDSVLPVHAGVFRDHPVVRTDIGLSYALTYFCPDKSSVSSLRPVSSCREAPANCKTGIFPTARCNHDITVCPASFQPISRRTHQLDTPAITLLLCTIPTVLVMRCLYAHIYYTCTYSSDLEVLYGSISLPRSILLHQL